MAKQNKNVCTKNNVLKEIMNKYVWRVIIVFLLSGTCLPFHVQEIEFNNKNIFLGCLGLCLLGKAAIHFKETLKYHKKNTYHKDGSLKNKSKNKYISERNNSLLRGMHYLSFMMLYPPKIRPWGSCAVGVLTLCRAYIEIQISSKDNNISPEKKFCTTMAWFLFGILSIIPCVEGLIGILKT